MAPAIWSASVCHEVTEAALLADDGVFPVTPVDTLKTTVLPPAIV
jgi:hypothetical protein